MKGIKYVISLSVCFFLILCFEVIYAQDSYQTEISASYSRWDDEDDNKTTQYDISAKLHFLPVNTVGHPLAEAAFLERIGNVQLHVGKVESKGESIIDIEANGPLYGAALTYAKPDLPVVLQAQYAKIQLEFESPLDGDVTIDDYGVGFGYFLDKSLLAGIQYGHIETDAKIKYLTSSSETTSKTNSYALTAKFVREQSGGTAYNIEGGIEIEQFDDESDDGSNTIFGVSGDYYLNREVSLGAGFGLNTGDDKDNEGKTVNLDFNAFLTPQFAVNIALEKFIADNDEGEDADTFNVGMKVRF